MQSSGDSLRFLSACSLHSADGSGAGSWSNVRLARLASCIPDFCCRSSGQFLEENLVCERSEYGNRRTVGWIPCLIPGKIAIILNGIVITVAVEFHLLNNLVEILEEGEDIVNLVNFVFDDDACCDLQQHLLTYLMWFHENFHHLDIKIL